MTRQDDYDAIFASIPDSVLAGAAQPAQARSLGWGDAPAGAARPGPLQPRPAQAQAAARPAAAARGASKCARADDAASAWAPPLAPAARPRPDAENGRDSAAAAAAAAAAASKAIGASGKWSSFAQSSGASSSSDDDDPPQDHGPRHTALFG